MKRSAFFIMVIVFLSSCSSAYVRNKEAREDAAKMAEARALQTKVPHKIMVDAETRPVESEAGEDAADDPAIWLNETHPEKSIIVGTNKVAGLYTYNINGEVLDFVSCGKINNVDIRDGYPFQENEVVLVAASNRTTQAISLYALNEETGKLSEQLGEIKTNVDDVYGFTLYKKGERYWAISNGKNGVIEVFLLQNKNDRIVGIKEQEYKVVLQPEGMVTIDDSDLLFVGVEEKHIRIFGLGQNKTNKIISESSTKNNHFIAYDIEGLAVFKHKEKHYLIASIQGSFTYAIFSLNLKEVEASYITSFSLVSNENGVDGVDGVEETDGLEVIAKPINDRYPSGILVVQDGFNYDGEVLKNQNFKIVDLQKVIDILE